MKTIVLQIRNEDNHIAMSVRVYFKEADKLMQALETITPILCMHGTLEVENNELEDFRHNGVLVECSKVNKSQQRHQRWLDTGN